MLAHGNPGARRIVYGHAFVLLCPAEDSDVIYFVPRCIIRAGWRWVSPAQKAV